MRLSYVGEEPYATLRISGTVLRVQVNSSTYDIDCRERQKTSPVHINVVQNADGSLGENVATGLSYVANIDIPAATVDYDEEGEATVQEFSPEDFNRVRVTLWTIIKSDGGAE